MPNMEAMPDIILACQSFSDVLPLRLGGLRLYLLTRWHSLGGSEDCLMLEAGVCAG